MVGPERIVEVIKEVSAEVSQEENPLLVKLRELAGHVDLLDTESSYNSKFGTAFPRNPRRGDTFLRVDTDPNTLYRFNGQSWFSVADLNATRLLQLILSGDLTLEDLTPVQVQMVKSIMKK